MSGFGTSIHVENRRLRIENKIKDEKIEFYPHNIEYDSIIIDGHTGNITFEALRWISKHDINLTLLNWNGNLLSVTLPEQPKSGRLRVNQYKKYLDDKTRFYIARKFVDCKVEKSLDLLSILSEYYDFINMSKIKRIVAEEKTFLEKSLTKKIESSSNVSDLLKRLMNYEGKFANVYLDEISRIFSYVVPEFSFNGRKNKSHSRNYNASDEINALFNYGYSVLESEVRKSINTIGLDYSIGFLHEINQSRTSLVYDIQELFRWMIDLSLIQLLEEKKLKKKDFLITENYNTRLRETAAKLLIEKIKSNFNRKISYKRNRRHTYQNILLDNAQMLANFISEKNQKLEFNIPQFEPEKNLDYKTLNQKVLQITPKKRRELGINKSTLWYLHQSIKSGKKPKIYSKVLEKLDFSDD